MLETGPHDSIESNIRSNMSQSWVHNFNFLPIELHEHATSQG